jgi:hypothetical protein
MLMMKVYLVVNSTKLGIKEISNVIEGKLDKIINIGDKKKYSDTLYDYNSCEYIFHSTDCLISDFLSLVKIFIEKNITNFKFLKKKDDDLYVSLRFVIELDGEVSPDTFFDTSFLSLLCQIEANLDIDLYYK